MASKRASMVVEDLETGDTNAEFERIKQNFRPSLIVTPAERPANLSESQTALQELQTELQQFLRGHLTKVRDLQSFLSVNLASSESNGAAHESHGTVISPMMERRTLSVSNHVDGEPLGPDEGEAHTISTHANNHAGMELGPNHSLGPVDKAMALDTHAQALHTFLVAHAENIRNLQDALSGSATTAVTKPVIHAPPAPAYKTISAETVESNPSAEDLNRQFTMLVVISTFTAALIVSFISLVFNIVDTRHKTAFNVGMFFSFISLLIHLGDIVIAGRGAALASQQDKLKLHDSHFFNVYLTICEQLQFVALIVFTVSIAVMIFLIFSSVAFPIVLVFLSLIGIFVVFSSAYWEVSITLRNLKYLFKNIQSLRQSLEYLKIRGRMGTD
ncbi:hypothetical protein CPB84DRAFT_1843398 [Gymnopilus junonius]|uniref:Uncharacterized protein n=1 Tax=Gymnopilus junonius TaxID=109634 RepID=A0A9P5NX75_GYMJU|nr:hypothetical protein CPB84DRAFT_1843398 [Gymnopilus junonius]